jgi:hypothetical protein
MTPGAVTASTEGAVTGMASLQPAGPCQSRGLRSAATKANPTNSPYCAGEHLISADTPPGPDRRGDGRAVGQADGNAAGTWSATGSRGSRSRAG